MPQTLTLDEAAEVTRTGDIWVFRGGTMADRAIQTLTNSPVNHVGMAVVVDDLPPLLWHAELGRTLADVWTGGHHRGAQLHDLRAAVDRWRHTYQQRAWFRQLSPEVGLEQEDAMLRSIARLDGTPFPTTARLAMSWLRGRDGYVPRAHRNREVSPEAAFCAEIVATTYQEMGLLPADRRPSWYDPGTFWSGAYLPLTPGWTLGDELPVLR